MHPRIEYSRQYNKDNQDKIRNSKYLKKFNITLEQYNTLFEEQQGHCGICDKHQSELSTNLSVDHCHKLLYIRGLLCKDCNLKLRFYEDRKTQCEEYLNAKEALRMLGRRLYIRHQSE